MPARTDVARTRLWRVLAAAPRVLRRILGAPDYAAYLDHCRRAGHPPRLSERQFVDATFAARGRAPRCC